MSVTHPHADFAPAPHASFVETHPQLAPFLVAFGMFVVAGLVALAFTGLPA